MNPESEQEDQSPGMNLGDIYFILFRQKRIIFACAALGLIGAAVLLLLNPPLYQSETKLFIRYVVSGKTLTPPGPGGTGDATRALNEQETAIINTEVEILQSFDLARQVADAIGPEKVLAKAGGGNDRDAAASLIMKNMFVQPPVKGSVLSIVLQHPDPQIAQLALSKAILAYYKKHAEAHQPVANLGGLMAAETTRLREELAHTEKDLRAAKNAAGITSLEDAKKSYTEQLSKIRESLFDAQAALSAHQAALGESTKATPGNSETNVAPVQVPTSRVKDYRNLCARLDFFSRREQELLTQFTESSTLVLEIRDRIAETEKLKAEMEGQFPGIASTLVATPKLMFGGPADSAGDPVAEQIQVRALKAKIETLNSQLAQVQGEVAKVDEMEGTISELQRKKDLEEADLKYFTAAIQQNEFNSSLGNGDAPNIGIIEPPTPAAKKWPKSFKKKVGMFAAIGVFGGIILAFLIELQVDRSVKRPGEVENKLKLPLFVTIPDLGHKSYRQLGQPSGEKALMKVSPGDASQPLRRYYEGLRNRLIVHFEIWNLKHKPKMVAVTSCGRGAGVSSTAAGLAASLSETGDGSVLLVDMTGAQDTAQHFYKGKVNSRLEDALTGEKSKSALIHTDLNSVANSSDDTLPRALPSRFATLVPKFKASDYDFIIFDMPPVSQTSITPRLAGFMDMVLLVIEAEKTNQDLVKQATKMLGESHAKVSAVLNKSRTYVPKMLHQETLDDV